MTSQIVKLPNQAFIDLYVTHWNMYHPLQNCGIDLTVVGTDGDECLAFSAAYNEVGLRSRPLGQEDVLAFVIAPPDVDVERWCWPRPLASQHVVAVIEKIQAVIDASDDLTAHDRIELIRHLEEAKTAPATGPRPIEPSSSCSPWHAALLAEGQALSIAFAPALSELERKLESYRSRLAESDCEAVLFGLSAYAELASSARFEPRQDDGRGLIAKEGRIGRRGSLQRSIDCATQLSDATQSTLRRLDPFCTAYRPLETIADLVTIHDEIQPTARSQRGKARWRQDCWSDTDSGIAGKLPIPGLTTIEAVPDATEIWLADRDRGRWPNVHPLVRSLLVHARFLWIRPFRSENGRIARLLLAADLHAAGWPVLPWELAAERNYDGYVSALRAAIQTRNHECLLRSMMTMIEDAIAIADRLIEVIVAERTRLAVALRHPDCLGPALEPEAARDRAEELLKCLLIEGIPDLEHGRFLLSDLTHLGVLERVSSPIGTVFSVPAVRQPLTALFE
ncbi:MAG TPA: Fic family protein [Candidatus Cybelea sp.]|nr:Fic family protein [Candidatus Cybelea sp.]